MITAQTAVTMLATVLTLIFSIVFSFFGEIAGVGEHVLRTTFITYPRVHSRLLVRRNPCLIILHEDYLMAPIRPVLVTEGDHECGFLFNLNHELALLMSFCVILHRLFRVA